MKKNDILAILILGEITAIFLALVLGGVGFAAFSPWILCIILPVLALAANFIAQIIGKKIVIVFQFAKFLTVGFANTAVDFGILNMLMWSSGIYSGKTILLFNSISFLVAVIHSYIWNKLWTFKAKSKANIASQFLAFVVVSFIGLLINGIIVYLVSTLIKPLLGLKIELWTNAGKVLATIVSLIWNFIGYKLIVFKKKDEQQFSNLS